MLQSGCLTAMESLRLRAEQSCSHVRGKHDLGVLASFFQQAKNHSFVDIVHSLRMYSNI